MGRLGKECPSQQLTRLTRRARTEARTQKICQQIGEWQRVMRRAWNTLYYDPDMWRNLDDDPHGNNS